MSIGDRIRTARKIHKLTQGQLGKLIGRSEISVRKYEADDVIPTLNVFISLADVFHCSAFDLMGEDYFKQDIANAFGVPAERLEFKTLQDYTDQELLQEIARRMSHGQV